MQNTFLSPINRSKSAHLSIKPDFLLKRLHIRLIKESFPPDFFPFNSGTKTTEKSLQKPKIKDLKALCCSNTKGLIELKPLDIKGVRRTTIDRKRAFPLEIKLDLNKEKKEEIETPCFPVHKKKNMEKRLIFCKGKQ